MAAFGRAFGALPDEADGTSKEQEDFIKQSVKGLAEEGKVICVRLVLFAEMMKGKAWTPTTLKDVGGATGVGFTFLDETFGSSTASPEHRYHQKAARAVLKALLPESGTDIKGHMKSYDVLLEASGYANRPKDFDDLIAILDSEIRLITPTDPEGIETDDDSAAPVEEGQKYYQLTHDYLVHSLRDWLTRKQRETRRGRAGLKLQDRSAMWAAKPENRYLPSIIEYLNIRLLSKKRSWTEPQRKMMAKAGRVHGLRWAVALAIVTAVGFAVQHFVSAQRAYVVARETENDRKRADSSVEAVLTAPPDAVPYAVQNLAPLREHATVILQDRFEDTTVERTQRLHAAVALAEFGQVETEFLVTSIKEALPEEHPNILSALSRAPEEATALLGKQVAEAEAQQDWDHKARLAIVALHLGDAAPATDMLQFEERPDPIQRTVFIETFPT